MGDACPFPQEPVQDEFSLRLPFCVCGSPQGTHSPSDWGGGLGKLRGLALRQRGPQAPALSGPSPPQLFLPLTGVKVLTPPRLLLCEEGSLLIL